MPVSGMGLLVSYPVHYGRELVLIVSEGVSGSRFLPAAEEGPRKNISRRANQVT